MNSWIKIENNIYKLMEHKIFMDNLCSINIITIVGKIGIEKISKWEDSHIIGYNSTIIKIEYLKDTTKIYLKNEKSLIRDNIRDFKIGLIIEN